MASDYIPDLKKFMADVLDIVRNAYESDGKELVSGMHEALVISMCRDHNRRKQYQIAMQASEEATSPEMRTEIFGRTLEEQQRTVYNYRTDKDFIEFKAKLLVIKRDGKARRRNNQISETEMDLIDA